MQFQYKESNEYKDMSSIRLSVIIPVYNAENYIVECLDSIINQNLGCIEIICVDDGSTDQSLNILRDYEKRYENIKVLSQANSFAGIARNTGLSVARGEYVHFVDVDDFILEGAYEKLVTFLEQVDADIIKFRCKALDVENNVIVDHPIYNLTKDDICTPLFGCKLKLEDCIEVLGNYTSAAPWTYIIKRSFIEDYSLKFNDLRCINDRSFYMSAIINAHNIYFWDEYIVMHRINNSSSLVGIRAKNYECQFASFNLIKEAIKLASDENKRKILGMEILDMANTLRRINHISDDLYTQLSDFFCDFDWSLIDRKYMFKNASRIIFDTLGLSVDAIMNCNIREKDELKEILLSSNNVVIYGAGAVTYALLQYLIKEKVSIQNIVCIAVTAKKGNPGSVLGIPVCRINEIDYKNIDVVIVSTLEDKHEDIIRMLSNYNVEEIRSVSNWLYACIRREIGNYEADILNNEYRIISSLNRMQDEYKNSIKALSKQIRRIEKQLNTAGFYYDEGISEDQYCNEIKEYYNSMTGKTLDFNNVKTFNEKIQWIKLYGVTPLMTKLTDKYLVREWIKEKIGEEYLVPLLGVWDTFEDIDFDILPNKFVLKCNHGSAWNEIVTNKKAWNKNLAKKKFTRWLDTNYAFRGGLQLQYRDIEPKIIAEEYMENKDGDLYDYKFWCFDGKVEFVMFLSERSKMLRMNNYDKDWNLLPFTYDHPNSDNEVKRPEKLEEMISIAEKLSQGFPHVRVDLYQLNDGSIKFGEMTFTSCNGVCGWSNEDINKHLGDLINID